MSPPQFAEFTARMTRLETLVGDTTDEGLRADVKAVREDVSKIKDAVRNLDKHLYMAVGGGVVALWILNQALAWMKG